MKKILEINDLKLLAKKKLPKMFYDYVIQGLLLKAHTWKMKQISTK